MGNVSRSSGRSCVQAVAYIAREKLFEERRGILANYTNIKDHEVFWETLAPEGSGIDKKNLSIWNKVEDAEDEINTKRYKDPAIRARKINSAVPAYSDRLALPKELTLEQNIELSREFLIKRYVNKGLIVTFSAHWQEGNPHLHWVYSARQYKNGKFSKVKTVSRETRGPQGGKATRVIQADIINRYQEILGIIDRVDPRPYKEIGHGLIPTQNKGYSAHQLDRNGVVSRIGKENERIREENKERIAREPGIIIKELTSKQATFSETDVVRLMQHRLKDDLGILGEHVFYEVMKQAVEVGKNIHEDMRYTSQEYYDKEAKILESLDRCQTNKATLKIDPNKVEELISTLQEQGKEAGIIPNEGQVNAIKTLCGDSQLSILVGRAGTGKTTTMKPLVKLHEEAGYTVIGMAPSATAAEQLEADTGCKSDTIEHYAYYWKKYDEALALLYAATTDKEMRAAQKAIDKYSLYLPSSETLIIIDEAGMIGMGDHQGTMPGGWAAITKVLDNTSAKLVLTGDDHQRKPVGPGDVFRRQVHELKGTGQFCELTEIVRQRVPWMREASSHLSQFNVDEALGMYENRGHIKEHVSNADVYKEMAQQYLHNITGQPDSKGIVITETNVERDTLNREIRSILKENGLLPKEDLLQRGGAEDRPPDGYTVGDKIIFTKNDRGWNTSFEAKGDYAGKEGFFVKNSMQAVIKSIRPCVVVDKETEEKEKTFQIIADTFDDKGKIKGTITFNLNEYGNFTHGYAVTGWKGQSKTLDWIIAKLSKCMNANDLYVTLTRHRDNIWMYYSKEEFPDYKALVYSLSRVNVKDLVVDYSVSDENKEFWQNVQSYKETGQELRGILALIRSLGERDEKSKEEINALWRNYRDIEEDRKSWAKYILRDWEEHKDFIRQAGLAREGLEIAAGLKKRSLSRVEIEAQVVVEQYVAVSVEARQLWRSIRRTHPGARAKSHPEWPKFEDARNQRGVLANQICLNPILYRPFLKETAENLAKADIGYVTKDNKISYSMATIKAQAEAFQSKILQQELLKDDTNPAQQDKVKLLISYMEARDHFGQMWRETRLKLTALKGSLLEGSLEKEVSEFIEMGMIRDGYALQIVEKQDDFEALANKVGIKLNFERLAEEAARGKLNNFIKTYKSSPELTAKLEAASEINSLIKSESELEKKPIIAHVFQQGLKPRDIARDALEYQKIKLFESLKPGPERELFLLLDEYGDKCLKANQIYSLCIEDTKGKDKRPWESSHYPSYKEACHSRNDLTLEIFDQRDHNQVIAMAEAMGIKFKDVDLIEIFSRCEQAARTRHILSYQNAQDPEIKGQAAIAIRQMIEFERREKGVPSKTAQQAYHSGIDFKELQATAFSYGRSCVLKGLSSEKEIDVYHALEAYENALRPANKAYKGCIDESKEKTTKGLDVKPWETEKFKEYISLVTIQDEKAYELIKGYDSGTVTKVAKQMGISPKKLDVEAHRHSLRQNLQIFMDGDRTNVPMAAQELLNWLEFDRHSDHKHTFKVLREQDIWPNDIQEGLQQFFEKKRGWRHEEHRDVKDAAKAKGSGPLKPEYKVITYERRQSIEEINKQLTERIYELATFILGEPLRGNRKSSFLEFKKEHKVSVGIRGAKQGAFMNFVTNVKGGPLKLIEDQMGLASFKDALKWASDWLGGNPLVVEHRIVEKQQAEEKSSTWEPIVPIPKHVPTPDIVGNKYLNIMLKDESKATSLHPYRDEQGNLLGYVVRLEKPPVIQPDGSIKIPKITPTLAYGQNARGYKYWKWRAFYEKENRTPYGIEKLAQDQGKSISKPILVVEGEKTADQAQKDLPGYHVLTWLGGAGAVDKTNWACLVGKQVSIWPDYDYDQKSQKAAQKLHHIITQLNKAAGKEGLVGVVDLPDDLRYGPESLKDGWDLADKRPKNWTLDTVIRMIENAVLPKEKMGTPEQKSTKTTNAPQEPDANIEKAAKQFVDLCVLYDNTPWDSPGEKELSRKIETLAGQYMRNEEFRHRIETCGNEVAIERFRIEVEEQMPTLKDTQASGLAPESILSKESGTAHGIRETHKTGTSIEKAANQFIDLCVLYENTPWGSPGEKELSRKIEIFAGQYMHSEEFRQRITSSENDIAINRFQIEMEEQMPILNDIHASGLTPENQPSQDGSSGNTISTAHKIDANIEKAANQFIDLCVLYENMNWDDPRDKETLRKIEAFVEQYMHNEEFRQSIAASKNEVAIERFQSEVQEQMQKTMSQSMSRDI